MKLTGEKILDVRSEDALQELILTTEELRKLRGLFKRSSFSKIKMVEAVRRILGK